MVLDVLPDENEQQLVKKVWENIKQNPKRSIKNNLKGAVPERFLTFILKRNKVREEEKGANIAKETIRSIVHDLKYFSFNVHGSLPLEKAFVTGGGVSIKEIVPNTMQSKKMHGLYFCGEILDIHGYTGGYNITSALVTGRLAGINAATETALDV